MHTDSRELGTFTTVYLDMIPNSFLLHGNCKIPKSIFVLLLLILELINSMDLLLFWILPEMQLRRFLNIHAVGFDIRITDLFPLLSYRNRSWHFCNGSQYGLVTPSIWTMFYFSNKITFLRDPFLPFTGFSIQFCSIFQFPLHFQFC